METARKGDGACGDGWQGRLVERVWKGGRDYGGGYERRSLRGRAENGDRVCWEGWESA